MRTTFDASHGPAVVSTKDSGLNFIARVRSAFVARRQRRSLLALDDRMLADIGISRSQAYGEADRPFFDLPQRHR